MTQDEIQREIDAFCLRMSEHTESIRVFVTLPAPNGCTAAISRGAGNYYAQFGHVSDWITTRKAETSAHELGQIIQPPEDDSEAWKG